MAKTRSIYSPRFSLTLTLQPPPVRPELIRLPLLPLGPPAVFGLVLGGSLGITLDT